MVLLLLMIASLPYFLGGIIAKAHSELKSLQEAGPEVVIFDIPICYVLIEFRIFDSRPMRMFDGVPDIVI